MNLHHRFGYSLKESWGIVKMFQRGGGIYNASCSATRGDGLNKRGNKKRKDYKLTCGQITWDGECNAISKQAKRMNPKLKNCFHDNRTPSAQLSCLKLKEKQYKNCADERKSFIDECIEGDGDGGHRFAITKMKKHSRTCNTKIKSLATAAALSTPRLPLTASRTAAWGGISTASRPASASAPAWGKSPPLKKTR